MDVFTFVVIIVIVSCGSGVINSYLKNRSEKSQLDVDDSVYEELASLRERVEVLERIITDEKYQLERELAQLERSA